MKLHSNRPLAKGQIWKTQAAAIEIVALGKRLIHYKVSPLFGLNGITAQLSAIAAMDNYLKANGAQLVRAASRN